IEVARSQSHDLVARLLDMARIELLTRHYGIDEQEFEAFCKGIEGEMKRLRFEPGAGKQKTA
ncbi:hypothetical protein J8J17_26440, partial [Mycobacterium tuberculosis]|nr:hypothetical protein [Mycobacterium tuberculosis]